MEDNGSQRKIAKPREFPPELLIRITNNFCKDRIIGHGGSGVVYKGVLDDGVEIAVKKLYSQPGPDNEILFNNEVMNLTGVQHQNIVQLIGSCYVKRNTVIEYNGEHIHVREDERLLCLEYVKGGDLQELLSDESCELDWEARYKIIKGTCEGLKYLQTGSKDPIYHLDLKPENILLDDDMIPKIGDFGLSRLLDSTNTWTTETFKGTRGYMPPEYIKGKRISLKSDVFSLGVVIIKVIAGEEGYYECADIPAQEFIDLVHEKWGRRLQAKMSSDISEEIKTCTKIGLSCVEDDRAKRPTISEIVDELNRIDAAKNSLTGQSAEEKEHTTLGKQPEIQEEKKTDTEHSEKNMNERFESSFTRMARIYRISTLKKHETRPSKHETQSVDVVTGAIGSLLPKLMELLKDEHNLQTDVKNNIKYLHKELEGMQAALRAVAKLLPDQLDHVVKVWAREVRDLSYYAEDIVDYLPVRASYQGTGVSGWINRTKARYEIADSINAIMVQVMDLAARHDRFNVDRIVANPIATSTSDPRLSALYKDLKAMVGIEVSRDDVIRKLIFGTDGVRRKRLKIVSIVGMGGLGKTALAKATYEQLQNQFDCRAFVSISQNPDMKKVFMDILVKIEKKNYMNRNAQTLDEGQLIDELRGLLATNRYFIVVDDIWDVLSWEKIKCALVDSNHGSIVVTTTRNFKVAKKAGEVYKLKALDNSLSDVLFKRTLFAGEPIVPLVPYVSQELLEKCGGVPLAIITMANLLAGKPWDDRSKVYNSIGFGLGYGGNEDVENTRKILLFSYYDLPDYLRTCLLHLNIFPEDHSIRKETLIWKWVGEGFVREEPGTGLFELGEKYFNELVYRSLIIPEWDSPPRIITGFRIHILVLDMIRFLSTGENFVTELDGNKQHNPMQGIARRLAVQKRVAEDDNPFLDFLDDKGTRRRVRSFNTTRCHFHTMLSLSSFKVLRVLAIEECTFMDGRPYRLTHLGRLRQLRYLGLYNTPIRQLPQEIKDLIFLQTLDLRGTRVKELPWTVRLLRQLKCLRADNSTRVPDWMGNLTSLEELRLADVSTSVNFVKELGKLTELREVEIWIEVLDENSNKALVESLGNLHKIRVLRLMSSVPGEEANWEGYVPPRQLHELRLVIASFRLPMWINSSLVPNLSYLCVHVKAVEEQDLDILGNLPELVSLELLMPSNAFPSIKGGGAFPKLRCFVTSAPFKFLPGAMLSLESFHFKVDIEALKVANFDFVSGFHTLGNLCLLQKVEVEIRSKDAHAMYVQEAVEGAVKHHPNSPTLDLKTQVGMPPEKATKI